MARIARLVVPHCAHHVTQRGNRRQTVFFSDDDYRAYLQLLATWCSKAGTAVWAYCLMPNHIHLILVPDNVDGLRAALGETHRRYTRAVNFREGWRGHLWQERFHSFAMDEGHLAACARYVELNPVRAGLVGQAADWPWSSAGAHLRGADDGVVAVAPLLTRYPDWAAFLREDLSGDQLDTLRLHGRTGRPLGADHWLDGLEAAAGRPLRPQKPGRPKVNKGRTGS